MPKYTDKQLAQAVRLIIDQAYPTPDSIRLAFAAQLNRVAKSLSSKQLIASELEALTGNIAKDIFKDLHYITLEVIENQLSDAIKNENYHNGINLRDYQSDFQSLAKDLVSKLIKLKVDAAKKSLRAQQKAMTTKPKIAATKKPKKR